MWLYQSFLSKIFMRFYNFDRLQLLAQSVRRTMYLAFILFIYSSHEFSVLLSILQRSGLLLRYWIPACLMCKWWLGLPYNWWETARKKQSPSPRTSIGLDPSCCNRKFNNVVEPTANVVWLFIFCSGPGFNSISLTRCQKLHSWDTVSFGTSGWFCCFVIKQARATYLSLRRFTCLTILEWPRNSFAYDGVSTQQCWSLHGNISLKLSSGNSYQKNY